jgi:hypothetical protein
MRVEFRIDGSDVTYIWNEGVSYVQAWRNGREIEGFTLYDPDGGPASIEKVIAAARDR